MAYCCGLCVLSVSWALVLYSRACCLIRPGHLAMPPAALLCQLVWRAGMLGARVTCLMFFARVFDWWVCGVAGTCTLVIREVALGKMRVEPGVVRLLSHDSPVLA